MMHYSSLAIHCWGKLMILNDGFLVYDRKSTRWKKIHNSILLNITCIHFSKWNNDTVWWTDKTLMWIWSRQKQSIHFTCLLYKRRLAVQEMVTCRERWKYYQRSHKMILTVSMHLRFLTKLGFIYITIGLSAMTNRRRGSGGGGGGVMQTSINVNSGNRFHCSHRWSTLNM